MHPGLCTAVSSSGFWQGLWDGITAPITLVASLFFNVSFLDVCARSWWYNCMFLVGVVLSLVFGIFSPTMATFVFLACLVTYMIWLFFANIFYIAMFLLACACAAWLYKLATARPPSAA